MSDEWRCAGCGIAGPDTDRRCDCQTNVVCGEGRASAWKTEPAQPLIDTSARAEVGEIGNQIHNIACELQGQEELQERLGELSSRCWRVAQELPSEPNAIRALTTEGKDNG